MNESIPRKTQGAAAPQLSALQAALSYADLGYVVVQIYPMRDSQCGCGRPTCASPGKHPIGGDRRFSRDPEELKRWWAKTPDAGVGINLAESHLLDVSADNSGVLADFRQRGLTETASFESGSGPGHEHHLYRRPPHCPTARKCQSGVLDLISSGIAVLPPSVSGKGEYRWLTPLNMPVTELPEAPAWAVDELMKQRLRDDQTVVDRTEPPVPLGGDALERWHGRIVEPGDTSLSLVRIANDLARAGMTPNGIYEALQERDRTLGFNKFSSRNDAEIRYAEIAASATERYGRTTAASRRFTILSVADYLEKPAPPWLIKGILPVRGLAGIVGDPGTYKTFIALGMGLAASFGMEWAGFQTKQVPVLYMAAEGGFSLQKRIKAWMLHENITEVPNFHVLPDAPQLLRDDDVDALIDAISALPTAPGLIFLDTLARTFVGGNENSAEHMSQFIWNAGRIQQATGASVVIIHHNNREGSYRGSSALPGALDTMISMKSGSTFTRVRCDKQKEREPFEEFRLNRLVVPVDGQGPIDPDAPDFDRETSLVFERAELATSTGNSVISIDLSEFNEQQRKIIDALTTHKELNWTALFKASGIGSRDTFSGALLGLVEQGRLEFRKDGQKKLYSLT